MNLNDFAENIHAPLKFQHCIQNFYLWMTEGKSKRITTCKPI